MIVLALLGCLDRVLEGPYVLAPGLGDVRSLSPSVDGRLLVATSTGVYEIDGEGRTERIEAAPAIAVATHPGRAYVLRDGRVTWAGGGLDVPGAIDILGGYDALIVLYPDRLSRVDPDTGTRRDQPFAPGLVARSVALGPDGGYLVVSESALHHVSASGTVSLVTANLVDARAATLDAKGRVYLAQGAPEELWRVDPTGLVSVARWLGDPKDLQFGLGGLLSVENTYIANGAGTLDYVRPPP
ncbi:MAG: hypothetical protein V4850_17155 [Myxococcota bacterium]